MIALSTLNSQYLPPARPTAQSDSDPISEPQPRKIKGSSKLKRWSISRAIQSGRKLDRPSHRNPVAEINSPVQQPRETEFRDSTAPARERYCEIAELTTAKSIYVISDGTGRAAELAVSAALGQFDCCLVDRGCPVKTHLFSGIEDVERLLQIIKQAAKEGALVVYALADPSLSEAMEFTIKHDDGALPKNLYKADIVLAGISRTGKTRLSIYLAQKGYKVANVPIVMGVKLPESLFSIDPEKVFGLTINPGVLQMIRRARAESLGFTGEARSNYSEMDHVREELEFARKVFAQNPVWPVIEVTGKAIEETAAVVLRLYHDRKNKCEMPAISERY